MPIDARSWRGRAPLVALVDPIALVAVLGWERRWMSDDGFIDVRVVELVESITAPMPVGRFAENLFDAPRLTRLRVPADPVAAPAALCD